MLRLRSSSYGVFFPLVILINHLYFIHSDDKLLADSSNFQIFPSSSSTTSVASDTTSKTQTPPSGSATDTGAQPPHKSTNLGLIIGAALGGLGAILLVLIVVVLIRQRNGKKMAASYELDGTSPPSKLEKGIALRTRNGIQPYTVPPPLEQISSPSAGSGPTPPDSAATSSNPPSTMSKKMRMLRERMGPSGAETSSSSSPISSNPDGNPLARGSRNPNATPTDLERLRQEREKLNKQIAFLEGRAYVSRSNSGAGAESRSRTHSPTSSSVSASSSARVRAETQLAQQVEVLKEQVRALEGARITGVEPGTRPQASGKKKKGKSAKLTPIVTQDLRNQRAATPVPSEPPPGYAESPGSPTPIASSALSTKTPQQLQTPLRLVPNR